MKILDTFAGIGGFSYAAEKLVGGFETTQFVEIDPYCQKVLKKHWPHVPIHDDITTFTAKPFQYDVVCGGFPCQSISQSGTREGITETYHSDSSVLSFKNGSGVAYSVKDLLEWAKDRSGHC